MLNNMDLGIFSLDVWVGACGVLCVCGWVSMQTHLFVDTWCDLFCLVIT